MTPSRRHVLVLLILATLAAAAALWWPRGEPKVKLETTDITVRLGDRDTDAPLDLTQNFPADARPKNLVLFVGDGMGFQQILAARIAFRGLDRPLTIERLPITGWSTTYAVGSMLTDSAAGATALATGHKSTSGSVGVDAEGQPLTTIAERAVGVGKAVGVLTDSYLWDATPAAFLAHRPTRRDRKGIHEDMMASGAELLIGGRPGELPPEITDSLFASGYRLIHQTEDAGALRTVSGPTAVLLDEDSVAEARGGFGLPELTEMAFDRLAADEDGFFLMVETEETDSGSHNHDLPRTLAGIDALDRSVATVLRRAVERRDTLVVVTADHETGGFVLHSGDVGEPLKIAWT
ncbi:MAG: alkaline phosphatase, partial [Acidobacteriota bacterium]